MLTGRPRQFELTLTETERRALTAAAHSRTLPYSHVRRAQIILRSAGGESNTENARAFGLAVQTVGHWRRRFHQHGLAGLSDAPRSGHPRTYDDERVAALLKTVLASRPRAGTHWSIRTVAAETGVSKSTVQRYFTLFGVQPHRTRSFSLSPDPLFVDKVRDVVGLYLNPPDKALVLCVDEKSQVQALERTQPPSRSGSGTSRASRRATSARHYDALRRARRRDRAPCSRSASGGHRHQEFLRFLERIDASVPPDLDVHLVIDNYATHKHAAVRAWLAGTAPVPRALHAHVRLVAQPGRAVVRLVTQRAIRAASGARHPGAGAPHRGVRGRLQRHRPAVRLDRPARVHPRQARATTASDQRVPTLEAHRGHRGRAPQPERHEPHARRELGGRPSLPRPGHEAADQRADHPDARGAAGDLPDVGDLGLARPRVPVPVAARVAEPPHERAGAGPDQRAPERPTPERGAPALPAQAHLDPAHVGAGDHREQSPAAVVHRHRVRPGTAQQPGDRAPRPPGRDPRARVGGEGLGRSRSCGGRGGEEGERDEQRRRTARRAVRHGGPPEGERVDPAQRTTVGPTHRPRKRTVARRVARVHARARPAARDASPVPTGLVSVASRPLTVSRASAPGLAACSP
jgi:transposase